jgi:hypothetical protein
VTGSLGALTDVQLLRKWQESALVCVCRDAKARRETVARGGSHSLCGWGDGDWCGPQRKAATAFREIRRRKLPLPLGIHIALGEDNSCGRRKLSSTVCEFDELMVAHIAELEAPNGS